MKGLKALVHAIYKYKQRTIKALKALAIGRTSIYKATQTMYQLRTYTAQSKALSKLSQ